MENRPVWFGRIRPGSAPISGAIASPAWTFGIAPKQSFLSAIISGSRIRKGKFAIARRARQHPRRARYLMRLTALLIFAPVVCFGQQPTPTPSPVETETEQVVVTATRFDIPLDLSPASVSVINSEDFEQKQIERVSDALREVPGLSVVQTGTAGQLTSVFTRGLRSEHTQVLLDGIPINQGLQGAFNFGDLTTDNIDRIEIVRGPQSTLYGPRALAGVFQIFTKRGSGPPSGEFSFEGGSNSTFRGPLTSSGSEQQFDYSVGLSGLTTDNERPNNQYRLWSGITNLGWSPNEQLRISTLLTYSLADLGLPNTIFSPHPLDNFLTERWMIAPHIDFKPVEWWHHRLIFSYDEER